MKCFYLFLFFLPLFSSAQKITGTVKDSTNIGIDKATVSILSVHDSSILKYGLTDAKGNFIIELTKAGKYNVRIKAVGYKEAKSEAFELGNDNKSYSFDFVLIAETQSLQEVTVTSRKPLLEITPDKTVLNVENSITGAGNNALELLQKAPGVLVDKDDNILLSGKNGVRLYIDGRPSPLSMQDIAAQLRTVQAADIEAIEIITNPSARYEAAGSAGIINIRMKKNKNYGLNGSADAGYAIGIYPKYNAGVNLNYRNKSFNVFGGVGYNHRRDDSYLYLYRFQIDSIFDQRSNTDYRSQTQTYKLGTDWFINKKHTLGILLNGNLSEANSTTQSRTPISAQNSKEVKRILQADSRSVRNRNNLTANLNYKYSDTSGRTLTADGDYGYYNLDGNAVVSNVYVAGDDRSVLSTYIFSNYTPVVISLYSLRADYDQSFKKGKLSFGAKTSFVKTDNTFDFYNYVNNQPQFDATRSNRFTYTEQIHAIYSQFSKQVKKWSYQAGVRLEQTISDGELTAVNTISDKRVKRSYLDLFPSLGLTYQVNTNNVFGLSYSRRIDRPTYQNLNPFENKLDELTYQKGNPFLRPQYSDKIELKHTYKYTLSTSLSYTDINDFFASITDTIEGRRNFITQRNLAHQKVISFSVSYPFTITKWWSGYANAGVNHSRYRAVFEQGKTINLNATVANLYQQQTFTLSKKWAAELSGFYLSPYVWGGTYECRSIWSLDAGVQRKILAGQGSIKGSVSDLFKRMPWTGISRFGGLIINGGGGWESRQFRISFTYRFGNKQVKAARQRNTGLEELNRRVQ